MNDSNLYTGKTVQVAALADGFVELRFDRDNESINKIDRLTARELGAAVDVIAGRPVRGVVITSSKETFIVGADITEFNELFALPDSELAGYFGSVHVTLEKLESVPAPIVVAINGFALGGGLELALTGDYRVVSDAAQIGLPEVTLGLFPGFGGTVRLPRVIHPRTAIDWIVSGKPQNAQAALQAGAVDAVVTPGALRETALDWLAQAARGELDWRSRRKAKEGPIALAKEESSSLFANAAAEAERSSPKHQPAAAAAVRVMAQGAHENRHRALELEAQGMAQIAKTQAAGSLIQAFLNDQAIKKKLKAFGKTARPVRNGAVLGAGIMGGGIAYTSALNGVPAKMKDIAQPQLDLGMNEARKQLGKQIKSGRLKQEKADAVLHSITPQLDYAGFDTIDMVIEAVVENIKVKHAVFTELETKVRPDTVIASNTSSLRIDDLAQPLARPEHFVGMHFFNPVPVMPLVEIVKGAKTNDASVATAVSYALTMRKTPIVVKDCPGFLVNRILTAYMRGFLQIVADGADFEKVDRVMEEFGWPMGPAYLEDVIGLDTGAHVNDIISAGYPQRMPPLTHDALRLMAQNKRFGQKNGLGFYRYEADAAGKPIKKSADDTRALLASVQPNGTREFSDQEIIERLMLPMIIEAAYALEEGVAASAAELDTALVLGLGFPRYAGGPLKYADWLGLKRVVELARKYQALGKQYEPSAKMLEMAAQGRRYHH